MERNVMGELGIYRTTGVTPNFSDIARRHGVDRKTVAKYWRQGDGAGHDGRSDRESGFARLEGVIREKAALPGVTKKAIHEFLLDRHAGEGLPGYGAFTKFCRANGIEPGTPPEGPEPHPRFETPPGRQMQFDWKEDLRMVDRNGEVFEFNVFSATLGYSRYHRFLYSPARTTDCLLLCLLDTLLFYGGAPEEAITDNMSALVVFSGGRRVRSERAWRFAREAGFDLQLCAPFTPETKGKDESANRFVDRLGAYDGDFDGLEGLLGAIARIESRSNSEVCESTGLPPAALFAREKEYLRPLGNVDLLRSMVGDASVQTVPPTMLVRAAGRYWSVPRRCIGRKATVVAMPGGQVVVKVGGETVAVHDPSEGRGKVVYSEDHYAEAIGGKPRFADADIREAARANLALLDAVGGE